MAKANRPTEYLRIPFLGFEIEKRTDFLALAAFCLAAISASYQLVGYFRGSDVNLVAPGQITIVFDSYQPNLRVTRIQATMAYVNRAESGYSATVAEEVVSFEVKGRRYEQVWQTFQTFDVLNKKLLPRFQSEALPTSIPGGSTVSHGTFFAPHPKRCDSANRACKKWANLITASDFLAGLNGKSELTFKFSALLYGGDRVEQSCTIDVDKDFFATLAISGWHSPPCWSSKE